MARTRRMQRSASAKKVTKSNSKTEGKKIKESSVKEAHIEEETPIEKTIEDSNSMEIEEEKTEKDVTINQEDTLNITEQDNVSTKEGEDKDIDDEPSSPKKVKKTSKKEVIYPEDVLTNENYALFLSLYRDRESVETIVAESVKDLKKIKNKTSLQLIAMILYLSDLKLKSTIKKVTSLQSLSIADLIEDSQEKHLLPFKTYSYRSPSTFSYKIQFRRISDYWKGLGRNLFILKDEVTHSLLEMLLLLTTYNHRNLRFVATSAVLSILEGIIEVEKETKMALEKSKGKKKSNFEDLVKECNDMEEQLFVQVLVHRIRDVFAPTRLLCVVMIGHYFTLYDEYVRDDYIKYLGSALGDSDHTVRLEAVRMLIQLISTYYNTAVQDLLSRYKTRIIFMSRDTSSIIIIAIIRLITFMKEKGLISGDEDSLIYELAIDSDRQIGNRAFQYLYKYKLTVPIKTKSKKGKKKGLPENSQILIRVLDYLEEYAQDDNEVNHVFFFIRNVAGSGADIINEDNEKILNLEEIIALLSKQKQELGLTERQLILLSTMMNAIVQLFHNNQGSDIQSPSYALYEKMNELVISHIATLITTYKTDSNVVKPLVKLIEFLHFPDLASISAIASLLMELFKTEVDNNFANSILNIISHFHVNEPNSNSEILKLLSSTYDKTINEWKEIYNSIKDSFSLFVNDEVDETMMETCRSLCLLSSRLCNLLSYMNVSTLEQNTIKEMMTALQYAIKNQTNHVILIELKFYCYKYQQLLLLYQLAQKEQPEIRLSSTHNESITLSIVTWLNEIQETIQALVQSSYPILLKDKTQSQKRKDILLGYLCMISDVLIPINDSLITEQLTQTLGDLIILLLLGYHDNELGQEESEELKLTKEEFEIRQQIWTKQVLSPLYRCCCAHAATILPSCLFFFIADYGTFASQLCRDLIKNLKEKDVKCCCHLLQDAYQFTFTVYKQNKRIIYKKEKNTIALYDHFINVSRKIALSLGIQLSYDMLMGVFTMIRECITFVSESKNVELIEFYEALIPLLPKLTKEAHDLLLIDLDKTVDSYNDDDKELLMNVIKAQDEGKEEQSVLKYVKVFSAFRAALKKEKSKKKKEEKEVEKGELKPITTKGKKRVTPTNDKAKKPVKRTRKTKK